VRNSEPVDILLVDDQPAKLLAYEVILSELGENLVKASSAREALIELLKRDVAVVLIDVQMPELDGFELASMIREHPRYEQTPLIFVSAIHLSDLDRLRGYESGAVDYVPVPVAPEVLRAKTRIFTELHRKTRQLEWLNADLEQRVAERTAALEASTTELRRLNADLETRVEERTREREDALGRLFEAQKIETIGQLTGGVAHDFNNLLMAMLGSLELLKKRIGSDPASARLIENALKGAERGTALTQRLLAFARRQELMPEPVNVRALIEGIGDLLKGAVGPNVHLDHQVPEKLPAVLIDPNQFELALLNLAVNARDAMPKGGVLTFAAEEFEAQADALSWGLTSGAYVRLSVIDNGIGMSDDVLARATEPFFTTKGVGKGTGLGLPMVYGLAAQSKGVLRLSSRPDGGARVDLYIPVAPTSSPATISKPDGSIRTEIEPRRILVVDDDVLVSSGSVAMLEDLGHTALEANSGAAALRLLTQDSRVDLVITDHVMPEMTGLQLARRLSESHPDLPVILATGYADLDQDHQTQGALPRLAKPFTQGQLGRMVALHARRSPV
jgi:signal transduction histidine kinase